MYNFVLIRWVRSFVNTLCSLLLFWYLFICMQENNGKYYKVNQTAEINITQKYFTATSNECNIEFWVGAQKGRKVTGPIICGAVFAHQIRWA